MLNRAQSDKTWVEIPFRDIVGRPAVLVASRIFEALSIGDKNCRP
jgi:hypothetical protein